MRRGHSFAGARIPDSTHRALSRLARGSGHTLPQYIRQLFDTATAENLKVPARTPAGLASDGGRLAEEAPPRPQARKPKSQGAALRINEELAVRLTAASALTGLSASDLLRIGLRQLLASIERNGFLRTGPAMERAEVMTVANTGTL